MSTTGPKVEAVCREIERQSCASRSSPRRGAAALITVLVVFVISVTLFGIWTKVAVDERTQLKNRQLRLQTARLAQSGLRRAIARRAVDAEYQGETWSISADALGELQPAEVTILLTPSDDGSRVEIAVAAQYPAGATRRAQITKQIEIKNRD